jgi:hypothetical protein
MNKIDKFTLLFLLAASLFLLPILANNAFSESGFYTSQGCEGCHTATTTCNGCHGHGTHSSNAKSDINVAGVTNKASYAPGETVTVTITGGYRTGWIRAVLRDLNGVVDLAKTSGNDSGIGSSGTYPVTLSAPAPLTPGTYTWKVGWYGNEYDAAGAAFGSGWAPDAGNPGHGYEFVNMASFTVVAQVSAPTISTVSPNSLAQGATNQSVTITGTNLTGGTVSFSNPGVTGGTATVTATSITLPVSVTAGATTGAGTVTVTTAGGSANSPFTVTAATQAPTISTVTPNSLPQGAMSQSVTIAGTNLTSGTVSFSNPGVTGGIFTSATATSITLPVTVLSNATTGAGTVSVTTTGGTASSAFTVTANTPSQAMIGSTGYPTLAAAYTAAVNGNIIMLVDATMTGGLTIDKVISLDGGYTAGFGGTKTGNPTILTGGLTVGTGVLTASDIAVM